MLCRPTNDVTVVALLPLAFVLVELPRRRSLALAIHCLLAFVIAADVKCGRKAQNKDKLGAQS